MLFAAVAHKLILNILTQTYWVYLIGISIQQTKKKLNYVYLLYYLKLDLKVIFSLIVLDSFENLTLDILHLKVIFSSTKLQNIQHKL